MADYKVVYRGDSTNGGVTWEPGCPLYLSAVQVARNTATGECYLQLKIVNVSDTTAESYKLEATIHYADGFTEAVTYEPLDANLPSHCVARPDPIALEGSQVSSVEACIKTVSGGGNQWFSTGALPENDEKEPVSLSPQASQERVIELKKLRKDPNCYQFAAIDHGAWWRCSCGTVNVGQGTCVNCNLPKRDILDLQNEDKLLERATQRKARKKRTAIIWAAIGIAIIAIFGFLLLKTDALVPNASYDRAMAHYENGEFEASFAGFQTLGSYRDAVALRDASAIELGSRDFRNGKFADAENWYLTVSDREAVTDSKRRIADEMLSEGKLAMAALMYEYLGEAKLAQETRYQYITNNFDGDYNQHLVDFLKELAKEKYKDATELLKSYQEKWKGDHPEVME